MLHNCIANNNQNFHTRLRDLDIETARAIKNGGCRHCGGKLHQANYTRIGFGIARHLAHLYDQRFSFCCVDCRRRTTPASVRFLGRRRFAASVFIMLCASRHLKPNEQSCLRLAKRFGCRLSLAT